MAARLTTLVTIALTIAFATGCGGSGGGPTEAGSPSKAEFVKQANAACQKEREGLVDRIGAYLKKHGSEGKPANVLYADMARKVMLPTIEAETKAVETLDAPSGEQKPIEAILVAQHAAIGEVAALRKVASIEVVEDHFNKPSDLMRAYGIRDCANSAPLVDRRLRSGNS